MLGPPPPATAPDSAAHAHACTTLTDGRQLRLRCLQTVAFDLLRRWDKKLTVEQLSAMLEVGALFRTRIVHAAAQEDPRPRLGNAGSNLAVGGGRPGRDPLLLAFRYTIGTESGSGLACPTDWRNERRGARKVLASRWLCLASGSDPLLLAFGYTIGSKSGSGPAPGLPWHSAHGTAGGGGREVKRTRTDMYNASEPRAAACGWVSWCSRQSQ